MKLTDIVTIAFVDINPLFIDTLHRKFNGIQNSPNLAEYIPKSYCEFNVAPILNQNEGVPVLPIFYDIIKGKIKIGAAYGFEEDIKANINTRINTTQIKTRENTYDDNLEPYSSHIFPVNLNSNKFPKFSYAIYSLFPRNDLSLEPREKIFNLAIGIFSEIVRIKLESNITGVEKILIPGLYNEHVSEEESACLVYRAHNRINVTKFREQFKII